MLSPDTFETPRIKSGHDGEMRLKSRANVMSESPKRMNNSFLNTFNSEINNETD